MHFLRLLAVWWPGAQSARDNHLQLYQIFTDFRKKINDTLDNKPFLIWLLTTPPHLKCVATLPCNLSLFACFLTIMFHKVVWQHMQGVVGFFNKLFTANLSRNLPVKKMGTRLRFDRIMATSLWLHFFWHILYSSLQLASPLRELTCKMGSHSLGLPPLKGDIPWIPPLP